MNVQPNIQRIRFGSSCRGERPRRAGLTGFRWTKLTRPKAFLVLFVLAALASGEIAHAQVWESLGLKEREIRTIAKRDSTLFVGTDDGVYLRDVAIEENWASLNLEGKNISGLRVDPESPLTIYAGIFFDGFQDRSEPSLYKTIDGGVNWAESGVGFEGFTVESILGRDDAPQILYVSAAGQVFRSIDAGASWMRKFGEVDGERLFGAIRTLASAPSRPDDIYAGGGDFFGMPAAIRSRDGGDSWEFIFGRPFAGFISSIAISSNEPETIYFAVIENQVYKTTDGGRNYLLLHPGIQPFGLVIDPSDSSHLIAGGEDTISETKDGGVTWSQIPLPEGTFFRSMIWDKSDPTNVFVGTKFGVYLLTLPPPPAAAQDRSWVEYE